MGLALSLFESIKALCDVKPPTRKPTKRKVKTIAPKQTFKTVLILLLIITHMKAL
jgi:hypothetical protein